MAKIKKHKCRECGETKPSKFHDGNKSLCKKHYTKRYQRKAADIPPPKMSAEEQKAYINAPIVRSTPRSVDEALGLI